MRRGRSYQHDPELLIRNWLLIKTSSTNSIELYRALSTVRPRDSIREFFQIFSWFSRELHRCRVSPGLTDIGNMFWSPRSESIPGIKVFPELWLLSIQTRPNYSSVASFFTFSTTPCSPYSSSSHYSSVSDPFFCTSWSHSCLSVYPRRPASIVYLVWTPGFDSEMRRTRTSLWTRPPNRTSLSPTEVLHSIQRRTIWMLYSRYVTN